MDMDTFIYELDDEDTIVYVSKNWANFGKENGAGDKQNSNSVIGKRIWDYITDLETQHLYKLLYKNAREGKPMPTIPFRCDSPDSKRHLELKIETKPNGNLSITSIIRKVELRKRVNLLDSNVRRSEKLVKMCSMCKKVETDPGTWREIEFLLTEKKLFAVEPMPNITHGLCIDCYHSAVGEYRNT